MTGSFLSAVQGRRRQGARFIVRAGRRTLVESLYLLTAPVIAAAGLLRVGGGLCAATAGRVLLPGRPAVVARALAPARWFADLEWWRIGGMRSLATGGGAAGHAARPQE